jgi:lipopolysaccharide export system protein LptA
MKKALVILFGIIFLTGMSAWASDMVIQSKTQSFSDKDNKIKVEGDVHVSVDDVNVVGDNADVTVKDNKLDTATFYNKPYAYQIQGNKKKEVKANILRASLINKTIRAEGETQTTVFDGKEPTVIITADTQEYDTRAHVMTATGGVIIHYKDIDSYSNKAVIKTGEKGDLKRIELIGNAKIKDSKNNATSDHFIYDTSTNEMLSIGHAVSNARLDDGSKLRLVSSFQQFNSKSNTFMGSGNVKIWFQDYFAQGPKVTCFPDKASKKPNDIYFSGRSNITQGPKTIYADKIKITLKPKNFFATGNVKTVIKNIGNTKETTDLF